MFDLAQSFFVDQAAVANSDTILISSVDLYFFGKPIQSKTKSGIDAPGVSVYVCPVTTDGPQTNAAYLTCGARMEYANIATSSIGTSATKFTFRCPVPVATGGMYAFLIRYDGSDPDFKLWRNKAGEILLGGTTRSQVSSGKNDGFFYKITNGSVLTPERDADLKFKINICKFSSLSTTFKTVNKNYEILAINTANGNFTGGEYVWQLRANNTGTVSVNTTSNTVTGTGTSFASLYTVGDYFVISDSSLANSDIRKITAITNNTVLAMNLPATFANTLAQHIRTVVGKSYVADGLTDHLILVDSTANSSVFLTVSSVLAGEQSLATANIATIKDYSVNSLVPNYAIQIPSATTVALTANFANTGHAITNATAFSCTLAQRQLVNSFDAVISSRTTEVITGTPYKSFSGLVTLTTTNPYVSPFVREENLDLFVERYSINNDVTNEFTSYGNAASKYISKTIVLADGQHAEDIRVYLSAWRPGNTDIKVYARVKSADDPESFDLKSWTLLSLVSPAATSNRNNPKDFVEIDYTMPTFLTGVTATGTFTVNSGVIIVGTSGVVNTEIVTGALVRVYQPSNNTTFFYDTVTSSNSTTFTIGTTQTANSSLQQTGMLVDVITDKNSAFLNNQNQNTSRYMNKAGSFFDTYDYFAIKIVLLSTDQVQVPFVDNLRAIAVTA